MSKNIIKKIVRNRYCLILDEDIVTKTLALINKLEPGVIIRNNKHAVGNCGWANEPEKWFIHFTMSVDNFEFLLKLLNRKFNVHHKGNFLSTQYFIEKV